MRAFLAPVLHILLQVCAIIGLALWLNPTLLQAFETYPHSTWISAATVLLAGASLLAGQSVALFVNKVTPLRFFICLLLNGIIFAIGLVVWVVTIWLTAISFFGAQQSITATIRIVSMGCIPLVLGFLIMMPYLGPAIGWMLRILSLLIILLAVQYSFQLDRWQALVCTAPGWLLIEVQNRMPGHPTIAIRNWLWRRVSGSPYDTSVQDLVKSVMQELDEQSVIQRNKR